MTAPSCKLTVNDVLPDLLAYTARPGKATGGDYHLVIGNLNVRDHHVQFGIDQARAAGDAQSIALGEKLMQLSASQRMKLAFLNNQPPPALADWKSKQPKKAPRS